jgi:hypothetical protein
MFLQSEVQQGYFGVVDAGGHALGSARAVERVSVHELAVQRALAVRLEDVDVGDGAFHLTIHFCFHLQSGVDG